MEKPYKIVYTEGQGEIVEKKSRFIASIFRADTEEEALSKISQVRKKYYDARHNCFAYVIGDHNETERCSDDGEPSGTAGRPMLEVLTGGGIRNAVAVVTRYFGGTLLGTGGLARAYTAAVKEGLSGCVLMECMDGWRLSVRTDYNDTGKLQYLARSMAFTELETVYGDDVKMVFLVPEQEIGRAEKEITDKTAGRAVMEREGVVRYGTADGGVVLL